MFTHFNVYSTIPLVNLTTFGFLDRIPNLQNVTVCFNSLAQTMGFPTNRFNFQAHGQMTTVGFRDQVYATLNPTRQFLFRLQEVV